MKTTTTRIENMKRWINEFQEPTPKIPGRPMKAMLADPYVKAIRWASDRIGEKGIVAFVTNNSFLDGICF